jgi:hypothetical protein
MPFTEGVPLKNVGTETVAHFLHAQAARDREAISRLSGQLATEGPNIGASI